MSDDEKKPAEEATAPDLIREIVTLVGDLTDDDEKLYKSYDLTDRLAWLAHEAGRTEARNEFPLALKEAHLEALRYIDGWIENKFCQPNLAPAARGILEDMRVHIRAAISRVEAGEGLRLKTPLG